MKLALPAIAIGIAAVTGVAATAAETTDHKIVAANQIQWAKGPASIPPGAETATLYGNPGKDGVFAMRLKLPKGYHIPAHTHPRLELVTVISGTFRLGMGETADQDKAKPLPAGSFFALSPNVAHYAFTDEETVVQLNSTGPWSLTYVNPNDDPRQKTQ